MKSICVLALVLMSATLTTASAKGRWPRRVHCAAYDASGKMFYGWAYNHLNAGNEALERCDALTQSGNCQIYGYCSPSHQVEPQEIPTVEGL